MNNKAGVAAMYAVRILTGRIYRKNSIFVSIMGCLAVCLLCLSTSLRADTLYLRNGTTIDGKIVGRTASSVSVETKNGKRTLQKSEIRHIRYAPFLAGNDGNGDLLRLQTKNRFMEHQQGEFLIELSASPGALSQTKSSAWEPDPFLLLYGVLSQNYTGYLYGIVTPAPELDSSAGNLNIEYALTDWFSLGLSLEHRSITLSGLSMWDSLQTSMDNTTAALLVIYGFTSTANANLYNNLALLPGADATVSADNAYFDVLFHLPANRWDPYVRYSLLGVGLNAKSYGALRMGTGVRYYFSDNLSASMEAYAALYRVAVFGAERIDSVTAAGLNFSVGYRFDPVY